jgi:hypothetical protein
MEGNMKTVSEVLSLVLLLSLSIISKEDSKKSKIEDAVNSIQNWLEIIDSGSYSESWSLTGKMFKDQISDEKWTETLEKSRKPFGKNIERKLKSSKFQTSLPGVPDGIYIVTQFKSKFEKKKKAIETVTVIFEEENWKIVGYYIK